MHLEFTSTCTRRSTFDGDQRRHTVGPCRPPGQFSRYSLPFEFSGMWRSPNLGAPMSSGHVRSSASRSLLSRLLGIAGEPFLHGDSRACRIGRSSAFRAEHLLVEGVRESGVRMFHYCDGLAHCFTLWPQDLTLKSRNPRILGPGISLRTVINGAIEDRCENFDIGHPFAELTKGSSMHSI
jgi:hypothetical protein